MNNKIYKYSLILLFIIAMGCTQDYQKPNNVDANIIFLHHSTGGGVWQGKTSFLEKFSKRFQKPDVLEQVMEHNRVNSKNYWIKEQDFPKGTPYGWNNYPYDYYNIWVKNAGEEPYMDEPTLEMLTKEYNVIIFKHCFPVSWVEEDTRNPELDSDTKTAENFKLQYDTLKAKMHSFPNTKFLLWTGAALNKVSTNDEQGERAKLFFKWVIEEWNEPDDNIYIWDFRALETEGGLVLKDEYAVKKGNSHPSSEFNEKAAVFFVNRLIDVIENDGTKTNLKGENL